MEQSFNYTPEPGVAGNFIETVLDEQGRLQKIRFKDDEHFNFAYDVVDAIARKTPDKLAMLHISKNGKERRITFRDMMVNSNRAANYFSMLGIRKGDRVMLVLKRHYQFWYAILALHKIGAVAVPASFLLTKRDYEYRFKSGKIDAIVATADGTVAREIDKAAASYPDLKAKIMVGGIKRGWYGFNRDLKYFSSHFRRPEDCAGGNDPMIMFFTSGTTSYPKIATHSYRYALGHYVTARFWHQVDPEGIHFTISDTGWGKALWGKLYGQWLCEAAVFTYDYDEFFAKEILEMISKYHITSFCAPPTVYRFLVHADLHKYDLSSLKNVTTAGEALNPEIFNRFKAITGMEIMEGFGQTETTLTIGNLKGETPRPGSMGRPSPQYEIRIMRKDGTLWDVGETGEVVIRTEEGTPNGLFLGYYQQEDKTAQIWHDGYYHTGDTAYMDEDGYFWYVGRVDDIIKSAGYRIGPFEIENELMKLPYVMEVAVTAVPDLLRGQAIKASIVLTDGKDASDKLRKEILAFTRKNLASYKRPKYIEFVPFLPKTTSGKIRRAEVRAMSVREAGMTQVLPDNSAPITSDIPDDPVAAAVTGAVDNVETFVADAADNVGSFVSDAAENVGSFVSDAAEGVKEAISSIKKNSPYPVMDRIVKTAETGKTKGKTAETAKTKDKTEEAAKIQSKTEEAAKTKDKAAETAKTQDKTSEEGKTETKAKAEETEATEAVKASEQGIEPKEAEVSKEVKETKADEASKEANKPEKVSSEKKPAKKRTSKKPAKKKTAEPEAPILDALSALSEDNDDNLTEEEMSLVDAPIIPDQDD